MRTFLTRAALPTNSIAVCAPTFNGRVDPVPQESARWKHDSLRAISELVGIDWLKLGGDHSLRAVWKRDDWLASLELLTLGQFIRRIEPKMSSGWRREATNRLRSASDGNVAGTLFEIETAAILTVGDQQVSLPPENQRGFDVLVGLPTGYTLRASCKSLGRSAAERAFNAYADVSAPCG